jgi:enediyne biosynthesis protein E7
LISGTSLQTASILGDGSRQRLASDLLSVQTCPAGAGQPQPAATLPASSSRPKRAVSDRGSLLLRLAHRDIDSLTLNLGGEKTVLLNSPGYARHVLAANAKNYTKETAANRYFRESVADGILTADGERWTAHRALLNPTFRQTERLAECARAGIAVTSATLDRYVHSGEPINLTAVMAELTLAIATQTMFGLAHEPFLDLCVEAGAVLDEATSMLPTDADRIEAVRRALLNTLDQGFDRVGDQAGPVLRSLGADVHHQQRDALGNQALSLLLAGFETTANSLTWAWILLMQHPEVYARLQASVDSEGQQSPLLRAVMQESFRLYPSAWIIGRRAIDDDHIDGVDIAAGTCVFISPYLIQRHPRWWPDANEYRPERFLPDGHRPSDRYAYIPFGAGPRFCLGSNYAMEESLIIMTDLLRWFSFRSVDEAHSARPQLKFVLRAPDPFRVTVHSRQNSVERKMP